MNQDIHSHLEKLKTELNKLEPAVKHLQDFNTVYKQNHLTRQNATTLL